MKVQNLEQTIILKVNSAKDDVEKRLFKQFKHSKDADEREAIFAKMEVLGDITSKLINGIRQKEQ